MPTHNDLRKLLRGTRRRLDASDREVADSRACDRLLELPELTGPGRLSSYVPTDGELDPGRAVEQLRARGWTTYLPVLGDGATMRFAPWHAEDELVPNRFGIAEPTTDASLDAASLDAVLVPCVAVDRRGNRLGFGAGYYDRALAGPSDRRPVLVGVVYELQVVDDLEPEPWDVPLDIVVTEERVLRRDRT